MNNMHIVDNDIHMHEYIMHAKQWCDRMINKI